MSRIAVYPGSFDPVTNGHLDIIKRAAKMFDKVIVLVSYNAKKHGGTFTPPERVEFIRRCINIKNVTVDSYQGLLADYVKISGASAIVKGLRAVSDFEVEFQQALINRRLAPEVDTVFLVSSLENMYLSSSAVKEICSLGGEINDFVPSEIADDIIKKISKKQNQ
ncbi:MAG: pantetheine-phosphate adenylyltransferase [Clostridia bacterium]|nr:pantetheine-phosphate adenylyltransferase [Clostridia bacterium]